MTCKHLKNEWNLKISCRECGQEPPENVRIEILHENNWFYDEDIKHINAKVRKLIEERETERLR